jgi:hypothetical protein
MGLKSWLPVSFAAHFANHYSNSNAGSLQQARQNFWNYYE